MQNDDCTREAENGSGRVEQETEICIHPELKAGRELNFVSLTHLLPQVGTKRPSQRLKGDQVCACMSYNSCIVQENPKGYVSLLHAILHSLLRSEEKGDLLL